MMWTMMKIREFRHSLFFADNSGSGRQSLHFGATGSERETRPKGFDERINVYPLETFSQKNRRVNIYLVRDELKWQK